MRANKKEALIETAAKHFSKKGYAVTTLDEIAKDVGITKPAIYYHFKDKEALYNAVVMSRLKVVARRLETACEGAHGAVGKLDTYIETFGAFMAEYPCFAAILAREFANNGIHLDDDATKTLARTLHLVTQIVNEGVKEGVFAVENPMVVQMMVVTTLIMHQTTAKLRERVVAFVPDAYEILPDPSIDDYAKQLALKMHRCLLNIKERS